jgi:prephenate dehydrogenase
MNEPDFFTTRIAIIGLGLMGGSLALALHEKCYELLGCDRDADLLAQVEGKNMFARLSSDPAEVLPEADVVILATPVNTILELISQLPDLHPGSPIVIDLGSTKADILSAMEKLPARFDPLGSHPMCGKEKPGFQNAEAGIFQGAAFAFTPLKRTSDAARSFAEQLSAAVGAKALWLDAETHDRWCAATSHLPYLVASALAGSTPSQVKPLAGRGFRSTTRIAATPPDIMLDVLETNRASILAQLEDFKQMLVHYENLLSSGDFEALKERLERSSANQRDISENPEDE